MKIYGFAGKNDYDNNKPHCVVEYGAKYI